MNVFLKCIDFIDKYVSKMIVSKYGVSEMKSFHMFVNSETYRMLLDLETELYLASPLTRV